MYNQSKATVNALTKFLQDTFPGNLAQDKMNEVIESPFIIKHDADSDRNKFVVLLLLKEFVLAKEYYEKIIKIDRLSFLEFQRKQKSELTELTLYKFYKKKNFFTANEENEIFSKFRFILTLNDALLILSYDEQDINKASILFSTNHLKNARPSDLNICKSTFLLKKFDKASHCLEELSDIDKKQMIGENGGLSKLFDSMDIHNRLSQDDWQNLGKKYKENLSLLQRLRVLGIDRTSILRIFSFRPLSRFLNRQSKATNENIVTALLLLNKFEILKKYLKGDGQDFSGIDEAKRTLLVEYIIGVPQFSENDFSQMNEVFPVPLTIRQYLILLNFSEKQINKIFDYGFVDENSTPSNLNIFKCFFLQGSFKVSKIYFDRLDVNEKAQIFKNPDNDNGIFSALLFLVKKAKISLYDLKQYIKFYRKLVPFEIIEILRSSILIFQQTNPTPEKHKLDRQIDLIAYLANIFNPDNLSVNDKLFLNETMSSVQGDNIFYALKIFNIFNRKNKLTNIKNEFGQTAKDILINNLFTYHETHVRTVGMTYYFLERETYKFVTLESVSKVSYERALEHVKKDPNLVCYPSYLDNFKNIHEILPYGYNLNEKCFDIQNRFDKFNDNEIEQLKHNYSFLADEKQNNYQYLNCGFFRSTQYKDFLYFIGYILIGNMEKAKDIFKNYTVIDIGKTLNSIFYYISVDPEDHTETGYTILDFIVWEYINANRQRDNFKEIIELLISLGVKLNFSPYNMQKDSNNGFVINNVNEFISQLTRDFPSTANTVPASQPSSPNPTIKEDKSEPSSPSSKTEEDKSEPSSPSSKTEENKSEPSSPSPTTEEVKIESSSPSPTTSEFDIDFQKKLNELKNNGADPITLSGKVIESYKQWILSGSISRENEATSVANDFIDHYVKKRGFSSMWHRGNTAERYRDLFAWALLNCCQLRSENKNNIACKTVFMNLEKKVQALSLPGLAELVQVFSAIKDSIDPNHNENPEGNSATQNDVSNVDIALVKKISQAIMRLFEQQIKKSCFSTKIPDIFKDEAQLIACVKRITSLGNLAQLLKIEISLNTERKLILQN